MAQSFLVVGVGTWQYLSKFRDVFQKRVLARSAGRQQLQTIRRSSFWGKSLFGAPELTLTFLLTAFRRTCAHSTAKFCVLTALVHKNEQDRADKYPDVHLQHEVTQTSVPSLLKKFRNFQRQPRTDRAQARTIGSTKIMCLQAF